MHTTKASTLLAAGEFSSASSSCNATVTAGRCRNDDGGDNDCSDDNGVGDHLVPLISFLSALTRHPPTLQQIESILFRNNSSSSSSLSLSHFQMRARQRFVLERRFSANSLLLQNSCTNEGVKRKRGEIIMENEQNAARSGHIFVIMALKVGMQKRAK